MTLAPTQLLNSRKAVNALYFVMPPLGVAAMCFSASFSRRERVSRGLMTMAFLMLFSAFGPEMQAYVNAHMAQLAVH